YEGVKLGRYWTSAGAFRLPGEPLPPPLSIQRGEAVSINSSQDVMSFRERKRKTGCTRKLSFPPLQQSTEGERHTEASTSPSKRKRQSSITQPGLLQTLSVHQSSAAEHHPGRCASLSRPAGCLVLGAGPVSHQ
ncbi:hypothetical protein GBAR_LOCUS3484, partial [Geodia barretti]